jgi:hypothetical protein
LAGKVNNLLIRNLFLPILIFPMEYIGILRSHLDSQGGTYLNSPVHSIKSVPAGLILTAAMLIGLPLAGSLAAGQDINRFLEFPPLAKYVRHAGFSWPAFFIVGIMDFILFGLLLTGVVYALHKGEKPDNAKRHHRFPWWGRAGFLIMVSAWILAWSRFRWFIPIQPHTFSMLWLGYIITVNALCFSRSGTCPLVEFPLRFAVLFFLSSFFWWFFEYLNRFVQNWHYRGVEHFDSVEYVVFASISFSTVLPAVYSTYRWLASFKGLNSGLARFPDFHPPRPRFVAVALLLISGAGLFLIGVFPDFLFPLVWVSPLLIITALQLLSGRPHVFSSLKLGDWREVVLGPSAALICGFFWEMWNYQSLAKWEYAVPFVDRFHVFEMPILGYGGYVPFGLECLMICRMVLGGK